MNNIDFFKNIDQLPQPDKAALGKAAGKLLREASGGASIAFTKCIPTEGDYPSPDLEDRYCACAFIAGCLKSNLLISLASIFAGFKESRPKKSDSRTSQEIR